nr:CLIP-associated protein [Tanacetum cinerariifolium]
MGGIIRGYDVIVSKWKNLIRKKSCCFNVVYDSVQRIDDNGSSDLILFQNAFAEFQTGYGHPFTMEAPLRVASPNHGIVMVLNFSPEIGAYSDGKFSDKVGLSGSNKAKMGLSIENRVMWFGFEDRKLCVTLNEETDAPKIHQPADLYEDLLKCCVGDAIREVRSTTRACYKMFYRAWHDRSRHLFSIFEYVIQRIINDEDGGLHRRHASPSLQTHRRKQHSQEIQQCQPVEGYYTKQKKLMANHFQSCWKP